MAQTDLKNQLDPQTSLAPAARTASANGSAVDLQNADGALIYFHVGTVTDGTFTPSVEESDASGSGFAAVAAGNLQGTLAAFASSTNQKVGYLGTKRYIRGVVTASGTTTGGVYAVTIIRGGARKQPV